MTKMTLASALLMTLAFALLILGIYRAITAAQAQPAPACVTQLDRDRIHALTIEAIDQAFMDHVNNLFSVWVKDYAPEPKRAMVGMANGISAYRRAVANANGWKPMICKE